MRGNGTSAVASSPHSSDEAASRNGSPETKLTAFSPEDLRLKSRFESGRAVCGPLDGNQRPFFSINNGAGHHQGQDPFLSTPSSAGRAQLSPTATSFTPSGFNISPFGFSPRSAFPGDHHHQHQSMLPNMGYLAATSEPDAPHDASNVFGTRSTQCLSSFGPIGKAKLVKTPLPMMFAHLGKFDSENRNRAFAIERVPANLPYLTLAEVFNRREFGTLKGPVFTELNSTGTIYVGFTDIRDAKKASEKVGRLHPEWRVRFLTAREYAQKFDPTNSDLVSDFEGQVFASVFYDSSNPALDARVVSHSFKDLLETFGDIKAFHGLPSTQGNVDEFLIEFFDTRAADNVVSTLNGTSVDECVLELKLHKPDMAEPQTPRHGSFESKDFFTSSDLVHRRPYSRRSTTQMSPSPYHELSPTGRSIIPIDDHAAAMGWMPKGDDNFGFRPRHELNRHGDLRSNNQNFVDIERIRCGVDVRTTAMLKDIVDETSHGKYDFMYLRIDFANNCNFSVSVTRSSISKIDKVAEISYATIQGKDCLVQKFRNSSVMLEHPSFRPKIFHTGSGPLAGSEDRFPGPDNPSKMRRSVENAEHVGLFAPRVGQQYRDEQRRRRSQFDRGTTAAEREAYFVRSSSSFTARRGALNGNGSGNGNLSCSMMLPVMMSPCYEGPVSGAGGDAGPRSS
ncbi:meiosis protein MEI2 [Histoplasma capsulatum var. duboisii H88]|uniref:Meiosis protein MEI2 n=1 Tax=Ajellomyces capsulatus (strain H88) TaxID=544711 RepID=F0UQU8_AJEC8|nr:meiosis protein MEI2 [Histoplasma capsulatum var. duboisii H88]